MATTKFKGEVVELIGDDVNVGDNAPVVTLVDTKLNDVEIGGKSDKIQLIISVPSLETKVCAAETRK
ncbi:MAG: 2-Cys peroxiredoxin, partial [Arcobacteraceae bacterium]